MVKKTAKKKTSKKKSAQTPSTRKKAKKEGSSTSRSKKVTSKNSAKKQTLNLNKSVSDSKRSVAPSKNTMNMAEKKPRQGKVISEGKSMDKGYVVKEKKKVDHLVALIVSIFLGAFGIDRFLMGRVGSGILKLLITLLSAGALGWIWWLVDVILIATKFEFEGVEWV